MIVVQNVWLSKSPPGLLIDLKWKCCFNKVDNFYGTVGTSSYREQKSSVLSSFLFLFSLVGKKRKRGVLEYPCFKIWILMKTAFYRLM